VLVYFKGQCHEILVSIYLCFTFEQIIPPGPNLDCNYCTGKITLDDDIGVLCNEKCSVGEAITNDAWDTFSKGEYLLPGESNTYICTLWQYGAVNKRIKSGFCPSIIL
jgi:hypothetical protein